VEVDVSVDLSVELEQHTTSRMVPELETALYRIVQEALSNAAKHGGARRAVVEIREEPTTVRLSVRDDGGGFDPRARTNGFGLLGIRERVELQGGELSIESVPGHGATVSATLPMRRRNGTGAAETTERLAAG
jgi:signal transduction histidine kinase